MRHPYIFCSNILLCLLSFGAPTSYAQGTAPPPPAPGARHLALGEALRLGEEHVPVLVRARAEQRNVASRRIGAALPLQQNPLFTFLGGYRRETTSDPVATGFQYLEQQLEIAGQRQARLAVVAAALQAAQEGTARCRTPWRWAAARPRAASRAMSRTCCQGTGRGTALSGSPRTSSDTR